MATRRTLVLFLGIALLGIRAIPAHGQELVTLKFTNSAADRQARAINTWIDQASTGANHAADVDLHIKPGDTVVPNVSRRALLQFDLSRIPRVGVKSATLQVFLDTAPAPNPRNWEVRQVNSFSGFSKALTITWINRTNQLLWTAAGGDIGPVLASTATGTTNGVTLTWDVSSAVETWFGGLPPNPNYGLLIKDQTENTDNNGGAAEEGQLASNSNATLVNVPALILTVIQQVHTLTATPGPGTVTLNWTYPAQITGSGIVNATSGVVILRNAGGPVPNNALIADATALPALCGDVNGAGVTVVFEATSTATTTFTDPATCSAPVNGTTYFYKVFAIAQIGLSGTYNYSTNGTGPIGSGVDSAFAAEISATPGASAAAQQAPVWMAPVRSASLSAPGIDPGNYAIIATNNSLVQGFSPADGSDAIAPASIGGTASSRMPVLESAEADFGPNTGNGAIPMTYLAGGDNLVYDVGLEPSGFVWNFLNPLAGGATAGAYMGGVALQVKAFSNSGNTKPNDVMIMGTHVAGVPPTVNTIFAVNTCNLSDATPTGTGCLGSGGGGWNITGGSVTSTGCSSTNVAASCSIDIVTSTPFVDYKRNTVWVNSHNGGAAAGVVASPDVWKLNANDGTVLAAVNVGGDIDSSPTESQDQSVMFVGTNGGVLFAYDPANVTSTFPTSPVQLATLTIGDGAIRGFPLVANSQSPWQVIVSTSTEVRRFDFNAATNTFSAAVWTTAVTNRSGQLTGPNLTEASSRPVILVGGGDGKIHELRLDTGADEAQRIVDPFGGTVIVGDPSLDVVDGEVIVGASDGRVYAFKLPF